MSYLVANNCPTRSVPTPLNMVAGDTVTILRIGGVQMIEFVNAANNIVWQAQANGGIAALSNGYIGYNYDPKVNYNLVAIRGCTVTFNSLNNYTITTTGGDVYNIIFSPYPGIPTRFTQTSVAPTIGTLYFNYSTCPC